MYVCLHSHSGLEEEEASQPDSGPVMDSSKGGPKESVLDLDDAEDGTCSTGTCFLFGRGASGGGAAGELLPRHLSHETGCLSESSTFHGWGPGFLVLVLIPLLKGCNWPPPSIH